MTKLSHQLASCDKQNCVTFSTTRLTMKAKGDDEHVSDFQFHFVNALVMDCPLENCRLQNCISDLIMTLTFGGTFETKSVATKVKQECIKIGYLLQMAISLAVIFRNKGLSCHQLQINSNHSRKFKENRFSLLEKYQRKNLLTEKINQRAYVSKAIWNVNVFQIKENTINSPSKSGALKLS